MGYKSIGKQIQLAREEAGFNQEQLATRIGVSQSTLSNYEKGKRRIYLAQLEKIAEILNKTIQYFLQPLGQKSSNIPVGKADPFPNNTNLGTGNELTVLYESLSPEGRNLLINFARWLKKREVVKGD